MHPKRDEFSRLVELGNSFGGELERHITILLWTLSQEIWVHCRIVWRPWYLVGIIRRVATSDWLSVLLFSFCTVLSADEGYNWLAVMVDTLTERPVEASMNKHLKLCCYVPMAAVIGRCIVSKFSIRQLSKVSQLRANLQDLRFLITLLLLGSWGGS